MVALYVFDSSLPGSASVAGAISDLAGTALKSIKTGFLSCVRHVSNSLVSMKNALVRGFERMAGSSRLDHQQPVDSESLATEEGTTINSISTTGMKAACEAVVSKILTKDGYIAHMFRVKPERKPAEFNQMLADFPAFEKAIQAETYSAVDMGYVIKQWCKNVMQGNKFTMNEAKQMVGCENTKSMIGILKNKFDHTKDADKKDKLFALLSVPKAYLNTFEEGRQQVKEADRTVANIFIPSLFDINDSDLILANGDINVAKQALHQLLTFLPDTPSDNGDDLNSDYATVDDMQRMIQTHEKADPSAAKVPPNRPLPAIPTSGDKPQHAVSAINVTDFVNHIKDTPSDNGDDLNSDYATVDDMQRMIQTHEKADPSAAKVPPNRPLPAIPTSEDKPLRAESAINVTNNITENTEKSEPTYATVLPKHLRPAKPLSLEDSNPISA